MTGDQGAVLLCVQRNMNAFVTPPPLPKSSNDQRGRNLEEDSNLPVDTYIRTECPESAAFFVKAHSHANSER